ncbi:MAG: hypothetical protein Q8R07_05995 [Candidatus Uhrbacteria bacterium]|nr:hypothetical protein [Candidatus Uhrbacteria bacterium]
MKNGHGSSGMITVNVGGARNSQIIARAVAARMRGETTDIRHVALVAERTTHLESSFFRTLHRELGRNGELTILPDRRDREAWNRALDGMSSLIILNANTLSEAHQRAIFVALAEQPKRFIYTITTMSPDDLAYRALWISAFKTLFTPCVIHQTLGRAHGNSRPSRSQVRA